MCGIIGAVAKRDITADLITGLKCLEYRGYDSAGLAVIHENKILSAHAVGKINQLESTLAQTPLQGNIGIAHTRWATHGKPTFENAHPHLSHQSVAIVHNGIIENHEKLRHQLQLQEYQFTSQTDSEVIAHLIHSLLKDYPLLKAVQLACQQLQGAYAIGVIALAEPETLIVVRQGSPLIIGLGNDENYIASDHLALLSLTNKFIFLEEGDIASICNDSYVIYDKNLQAIERRISESNLTHIQADKGVYRHYMLKEIFEQPEALSNTLEGRINNDLIDMTAFGENAAKLLSEVKNIQIVACGTSYHAGMVARYWLEKIAKLSCQVEIASEFRYRDNVVADNTLFVTLSQSGETADTLEALRKAKQQNYLTTLSICNVPESSLVRESDLHLSTRAGAEIGVASTKAFTTQLCALLILTTALTQLQQQDVSTLISALQKIPQQIKDALTTEDEIKALSESFANKHNALFLGRGIEYPIALEGALKLKEISYIHAEAYPAGELKHGPLALVDEHMPVITVAPSDELLEKLLSNLQEVKARGGKLIIFADHEVAFAKQDDVTTITINKIDEIIAPIVFTIPLQLLAYYVAIIKGTDVDQPRNLAKSVTVE